MKKIKIYFTDFWKGFDMKDNFITKRLAPYYQTEINPDADYLFYSTFGSKHLKFRNAIKIYFTGENDVPDFNLCDYGIGFYHMNFEDRYIRFPLYLLYDEYQKLSQNKILDDSLANRKFCNFVYSNNRYSSPYREMFYNRLSKYKRIDSGGRFLNNIGNAVDNKLDFIKDYKFTIAFENSNVSGYTTEKIMQPMTVNSIPIYWGNPTINADFNPKSFINIQSYNNFDEAIEKIIRLDKDDAAYMEMLNEPWQTQQQKEYDWEGELLRFLRNILDQSKEQAARKTNYGFVVLKKYREQRFAQLAEVPIIKNIFK